MAATIAEAETVSPYSEMMAYEYIYAKEGTSRSHVSKILGTGGGLPTKAIATVDGLLPDETRHTEVRDYVDARIGGFSVLVDGTPQFPTRLRAERNPLPVFYYRGDISYPCSTHGASRSWEPGTRANAGDLRRAASREPSSARP